MDLLNQYGHSTIHSTTPQVKILLGLQLATAHEELKQYNQAITALNDLLPLKIMEDKIYFDLGRYHQLAGNSEKAKQSFDYVRKEYPDSNFAGLAEVYSRGRDQIKAFNGFEKK